MDLNAIVKQRSELSQRTPAEADTRQEPVEQLHQNAEKSRIEYENALLKEALALSSENCEALMKQSAALQAQAEQNRQFDYLKTQELINELRTSVDRLNSGSEQLRQSIDAALGIMTDKLKAETVQIVGDALSENIASMNCTIRSVRKAELNLCSSLEDDIKHLGRVKQQFFETKWIKTALFWVGCASSVLSFCLQAYQVFSAM